MPVSKSAINTILLVVISGLLYGQIKTIGTPFIHNYSRENYRAGSQTWDIEQGKNGMMYFANNDGLLEYDGKHWNIYPSVEHLNK